MKVYGVIKYYLVHNLNNNKNTISPGMIYKYYKSLDEANLAESEYGISDNDLAKTFFKLNNNKVYAFTYAIEFDVNEFNIIEVLNDSKEARQIEFISQVWMTV